MMRRIDLNAEMARLAEARKDPPGRVWAVAHPGGIVTVRVDGHPFGSRVAADKDRLLRDGNCECCDSEAHWLLWRDTPVWAAE